jgi:hypothetical protein
MDVSLNFMPAFYAKHLGVTYGEPYYFDPSYRATVERAEGRFLFEFLRQYGVGSEDPQPSPSLFIQPVDLIMRTQGARWRFPADATVESQGTPWAELTPAQIAAIDAREAADHPVIESLIAQYRELERMYGHEADIFGTKSGTMNIHTPYTTAHQLCGETLFTLMLTEPEGVRLIFAKVWEIYQAIFARVTAATGAKLTRVQLGDCSASMVSLQTYRSVVLPSNLALASRFEQAGYHSCGRSTHLLTAFRDLPKLDSIQLGAGTDLAASARLLPEVHLQPLVDPVLMLNGNPDAIHHTIDDMLRETAAAPAVTLCAWSFDRDTPLENAVALYEAVDGAKSRPKGN